MGHDRFERIKDMLNVPRGERQAWAVVSAAILVAAGWLAYEQWVREPPPPDLSREQAVLDAWLAERAAADSASAPGHDLFAFDPNHLAVEEWRRLGLSEKQALAIHKYEAHGGHFRSKADLARMRVVRPELMEQWWPFIQLPDSTEERGARTEGDPSSHDRMAWKVDAPSRGTPSTADHRVRSRLEVNTCDSLQLVELPGVGPSFARGIIKYREMLGGYRSLDQLGEVYVLKDKPDAVERLKTLLVVDTLMVRRIMINSCTVEELAVHPYARWKVAKPLIAYRGQHGPFKTVEAIKGCAVVTPEVFAALAPYLALGE